MVLSFWMLLGRKPGLVAAASRPPSGEKATAAKRWLAVLQGPGISLPVAASQRRMVPVTKARDAILLPSGEHSAASIVELLPGVCLSRWVPRRAIAPSGSGSPTASVRGLAGVSAWTFAASIRA